MYQIKFLEDRKLRERAENLYSLIEKDFTLIEKVCLVCAQTDINDNNDNNNFDNNYNNENEIINDINNGNYFNLYDYITPKKCSHFFHDKCKKSNRNKCCFCEMFLTLDNMKKFGCFFSKKTFLEIYERSSFHYKIIKMDNIKSINEIFYSIITNSGNIDETKLDKLVRLCKIRKKFQKYKEIISINYYRFYQTNYNEDLDEIENELDEKIKRGKKRVEEEKRREIEEEKGYRPIRLKRCRDCQYTCLFCHINVGPYKSLFKNYYYHAHDKCIISKNLCSICLRNPGIADCSNCCEVCKKIDGFRYRKCYYCKKYVQNDYD